MANYDGYYSDTYVYDYTPDPYNWDSYQPLPPPPLNKDWVDPVPVVRDYLQRIQPDCVKEDFMNLKETNLFLIEVLVASVELKRDHFTFPVEMEKLQTEIKLPSLHFLDLVANSENRRPSSFVSRKSKTSPSFSNFFQNIFTEPAHQISVNDVLDDNQQIKSTSSNQEQSNSGQSSQEDADNDVKVPLNRGKSALYTKSGMEMVQCLQQHSLTVRVEVTESEDTDAAPVRAEATLRLPESFVQTILRACTPDTTLPISDAASNSYILLADDGTEVGEVVLTLSITCLGCAVVNQVRGIGPQLYKYTHPEFNSSSKKLPDEADTSFTPLPFRYCKPNYTTSRELLRLLNSNQANSRRGLLQECRWAKMAQDVWREEELKQTQEKEREKMLEEFWRQHVFKEVCKDVLKEKRSEKLEVLEL